jgi:hypothetical protein
MRKVFFIPLAIAAVIVLAFATTDAYRVPTAEIEFVRSAERPARVATVEFEVAGLKCRGTSNSFAQQIRDVPGVISFVSYARTHTAIVEYNPTLTNPDAIRAAFEKPMIYEGKAYDVFKMVSQREL